MALRLIVEFVRKSSPKQVVAIKNNLLKLGNSLKKMPYRFPANENFPHEKLKFHSVPKGNYILYYIIDDDDVFIVDIHDARQGFQNIRPPEE